MSWITVAKAAHDIYRLKNASQELFQPKDSKRQMPMGKHSRSLGGGGSFPHKAMLAIESAIILAPAIKKLIEQGKEIKKAHANYMKRNLNISGPSREAEELQPSLEPSAPSMPTPRM